MAQSELEDALEELYGAGVYDSTGAFGLSAEKALEKLADFQLPEAHDYILHFCSAGLMAGAEKMIFRLGSKRSEISFRGAFFSKADLLQVFSFLVHSPSDARQWALQELAIALKGSERAGVTKLEVWGPAYYLRWAGEKWKERRISGKEGRLHFRCTHSRPVLLSARHFLFGHVLPEYRKLEARAVPTDCEAYLAQRRKKKKLSTSWSELRAQVSEDSLLFEKIPEGWITLGKQKQLGKGSRSTLYLNIRGRLYQRPIKQDGGLIRAYIKADDLTLDLSQTAPVLSPKYLALRKLVKSGATRLKEKLLFSHPELLDDKERRKLSRQVVRGMRCAGRLDEANEVLLNLRNNGARRACLFALRGDYKQARVLLDEELDRDLPRGLRPSRYFDRSMVAALQNRDPRKWWNKGYELLLEQHLERKGYILGEALVERLMWESDIGSDSKELWALWEEAWSFQKQLGSRHRRQCLSLEVASLLKMRAGELERALSFVEQAQEIRVAEFGEHNPILGQSLALKSLIYHSLDEPRAEEVAQERLDLMTMVYGETHPEAAASRQLLSLVGRKDQSDQVQAAKQLFAQLGIPSHFRGKPIVCFRAWFYTRSPWQICWPLSWS